MTADPTDTSTSPLRFHWHHRLASTNDEAKAHVRKEARSLECFLARTQTAGRGTSGRRWESPLGGLYFSWILPNTTAPVRSWLPFLCGIALYDACERIVPTPHNLSLKWPNDLLWQEGKVAGILVEADASSVVAGIGVNLTTYPKDLQIGDARFPARSFFPAESNRFDELSSRVVLYASSQLETLHRRAERDGVTWIAPEWDRRCRWVGREVRVRDHVRQTLWVGTFLGVGSRGEAVIAAHDGTRAAVLSGEFEPTP